VVDARGFALFGDEVEPAARGELVRVELEDAVGERVALAEVVEEPAVEVGVAERLLYVGDARGRLLVRELGVVCAHKFSCAGHVRRPARQFRLFGMEKLAGRILPRAAARVAAEAAR
jgi:hypothetical protein